MRKNRTLILLFGLALIFCPVSLLAQAPPGPLPGAQPQPPSEQIPRRTNEPQVEARKTLAGFWKLNTDESDDPQKKLQDARRSNGGTNRGGGTRTGVGFPFPGGGNGPYGGRGRGGNGQGGENNGQLRDFIRPANSLAVALKDAEVDLTTDPSHKLIFYTDGRKIQKSKDNTVLEISSHWSGNQLISDEKTPQGGKMSRTLELSPDGRQFYETLHVENKRSNTPLVMRYVYDAAREEQQ